MPFAYYKRRAKSRANQKHPCYIVLLPLKKNLLHSAALTQNASACRTMQFQPGGLCTLGGSGRRWVARGETPLVLVKRMAEAFIRCRRFLVSACRLSELISAQNCHSYIFFQLSHPQNRSPISRRRYGRRNT